MNRGSLARSLLWWILFVGHAPKKASAAATTTEGASDHCITSADCAFNGECSKDTTEGYFRNSYSSSNLKTEKQKTIDPETPGRCDCFAGWTGRTCEVLDLLPVDPQNVGLVLPNHDANVIRAPTGEFVLFVTALKGVKPKDCREPFRNQTFTCRASAGVGIDTLQPRCGYFRCCGGHWRGEPNRNY